MGCANSKEDDAYEADESQDAGACATSDMDELIRLKMIADAEHETFEAMEEVDDGGAVSVSISISDEDPHVGTKSRPSIAELDRVAECKSPASKAADTAAEAESARLAAEAEEIKLTAQAEVAAARALTVQAEAEKAAALAEAAEARVMVQQAKAEKAAAEAAMAEAKALLETAVSEKASAEAEVEKASEEKEAAVRLAAEAAEGAARDKATAEEAEIARKAAEAEAAAAKSAAKEAEEGKKAAETEAANAKIAAQEASVNKEAAAKTAAAALAASEAAAAEKAATAEPAADEQAPVDATAAPPTEKTQSPSTPEKTVSPSTPPSKQERTEAAAAAKSRMFAEVSGMKRREKSMYNRKKAAAFVNELAEKKHIFDKDKDVLHAPPLVQRQSSREKVVSVPAATLAPPPKAAAQLSVVPVGAVATSGAGAGGAKPVRGAPSQKPSMRKSIRNMFKSKRSRRPKNRGAPAAGDTGAKQANEAAVRKPGSVTVAEIDAGLPEHDEYERLDPRAIDAARWTDKSIRQLIDEIKKHGEVSSAGQVAISFGKLFDETANIFDALVGIIKTAKKYGVLHCNKDQLWQGQDDDEVITLIKDTHPGVVINRRRNNQLRGASAAKTKGFGGSAMGSGTNPQCHVCSKTVYQTEYVGASDKPFHKNCFRCMEKSCNRVLKSSDYCNVDDSFYCPACYKRLVMAAGGAGKETMLGSP